MKKIFLFSMIATFFISSCDKEEEMEEMEKYVSEYSNFFEFSEGMEDSIEVVLTRIESNTEVYLNAGNYNFSGISLLNAVDSILVRGASRNGTKLDFSGQTADGEGFLIDAVTNLIVKDIKMVNSKGDLLKIKNCDGVLIQNVHAEWEGTVSEDNGAYGLYPIECTNVIMDNCFVRGASDAGIYVGQTTGGEIKNCEAIENVAGIEIENSKNINAFNNKATGNTGGFLVFDLPGLSQITDNIKVYNNDIRDNNHVNFAPAGNIVAQVPPGTGLMVLSGTNIEAYDNTIANNNSMPIGIVNYALVDPQTFDNNPNFDPYPSEINIHDNAITKADDFPDVEANQFLGLFILLDAGLDGQEIPGRTTFEEIIYTHLPSLADVGSDNAWDICIDQTENTFLELDILKLQDSPPPAETFSFDVSPYDCIIP